MEPGEEEAEKNLVAALSLCQIRGLLLCASWARSDGHWAQCQGWDCTDPPS